VLPHLPPIQRQALETALLLGESEIQVDDRAVAAAFHAAVRHLATDGPLCVAVDDVQWLDAESLGALRYALARLDDEPIAALLAVRGALPDWLRRAGPEERTRTVDVGGLSIGAVHQLLASGLETTFPRPTLIRLWETSRGNPLFALELATALERRGGTLALGEELPIPSNLDEAEEIIATWRERAELLDRAWALAILARARGLLLAARGDHEGAFASFQRALAEHARITDPFHHARTLLALGRSQRRLKKRGAARATLSAALECFEQLGAPLWAEQTRTELARIGGRTSADGRLTDAESRIAALVAQGHTNREVAAALFLTPHSVETALTRVYRKLGVRSRTELASHSPSKT